jgi:hypothetical protein
VLAECCRKLARARSEGEHARCGSPHSPVIPVPRGARHEPKIPRTRESARKRTGRAGHRRPFARASAKDAMPLGIGTCLWRAKGRPSPRSPDKTARFPLPSATGARRVSAVDSPPLRWTPEARAPLAERALTCEEASFLCHWRGASLPHPRGIVRSGYAPMSRVRRARVAGRAKPTDEELYAAAEGSSRGWTMASPARRNFGVGGVPRTSDSYRWPFAPLHATGTLLPALVVKSGGSGEHQRAVGGQSRVLRSRLGSDRSQLGGGFALVGLGVVGVWAVLVLTEAMV